MTSTDPSTTTNRSAPHNGPEPHDPTATPTPAPHPPSSRASTLAFGAGLTLTVAGLALTLADQFALGILTEHQHQLYDPVGKYGQAGALYGYLYTLGALGVPGWVICLRKVRTGARSARRWSWVMLSLAALGTAPLLLTEYGQLVIPLQLGALPLAAWVLGLVGTVLLRRPRNT